MNSLLVMRVTEDSVVALDYNDGNIKIIRPFAGRKTTTRPICMIENVEIR